MSIGGLIKSAEAVANGAARELDNEIAKHQQGRPAGNGPPPSYAPNAGLATAVPTNTTIIVQQPNAMVQPQTVPKGLFKKYA